MFVNRRPCVNSSRIVLCNPTPRRSAKLQANRILRGELIEAHSEAEPPLVSFVSRIAQHTFRETKYFSNGYETPTQYVTFCCRCLAPQQRCRPKVLHNRRKIASSPVVCLTIVARALFFLLVSKKAQESITVSSSSIPNLRFSNHKTTEAFLPVDRFELFRVLPASHVSGL